MTTVWTPEAGEDGGIGRFPRSPHCAEARFRIGAGGSGGGASIALLAQLTHVNLVRSTLEAHDAGNGGLGGSAQSPNCDPLTRKACEVLDIGGGGGGAGGLSVSVLHRDAVFDIDDTTKLLYGAAGQGGAGGLGARWLNGTPGISGMATTILAADDFPPPVDPDGDNGAPQE